MPTSVARLTRCLFDLSNLGAISGLQQPSPERIIGVYKCGGTTVFKNWASFVSPLEEATLKVVDVRESRLF